MPYMTLESAKNLEWGTYGLGAVEDNAINGTPLPPMQMKRLGDLDDDHLKRILIGLPQSEEYVAAIRMILKAREAEQKDEARQKIRRRDAIAHTKAQVSQGNVR